MADGMKAAKRRARRARGGSKRLGLFTLGLLALMLAGYVLFISRSQPHPSGDRLTISEFVQYAEQGRVKSATVLDSDSYVVGTYVPSDAINGQTVPQGGIGDGHLRSDRAAAELTREFNTPYLRTQNTRDSLVKLLIANKVPTTIDQQVNKDLIAPVSLVLPALMLAVVLVYLALSYQRGTGLFGVRSGARKFKPEDTTTTFADVAGQDHALAELRELVQFLAKPDGFVALGATIPKGILLYGPPGCGKTLLARALAGEAGASFFSISGSDFVELYAGVGASRVRDLFEEARAHAPAIIFIDELDSIGRRRSAKGVGHGADEEQEQALNQVLAEMDGFTPASGTIVVAATNRPGILDPALLRPGRFDRSVGLERPDEAGRRAILAVHAQGKVLDPAVDLGVIAAKALGFSGADLASAMNEGALLAGRAGKTTVDQSSLELAVTRILEAPERQRRLSMRDREVGHRYSDSDERVTFADVAGLGEVVDELAEVREYLSDPDRFTRMGARVPRGILMNGPPGCGKTLLARAVAGESNAAFLYVTSTEFVESLVGVGAARVRDLFAEAKSVAPSILFIDEIDAIGAKRGDGSLDGHREREQTLNQILVELDGFSSRTGVIAIAATNRADILDAALVRPGRFDRHVTIGLPDRARRLAILELHARGKPLAADVDLNAVARLTSGFAGADLANILNEAVLLASRRHRDDVPMALVDEAIGRAVLGVSPVSRLLDEDERRKIAYHEVGHAIVQRLLPGAQTPHRITIVPQGRTLGATWGADDQERSSYSRSNLLDEMAGLFGGRVAEELVFGEPSSTAVDDLQRITRVARRMVTEYGMSDVLGPLSYGDGDANGYGYNRQYSEAAAKAIDAEVRVLVDEAYQRCRTILAARRGVLDRLAAALLDRETLSAQELDELAGPPRVPVNQPN